MERLKQFFENFMGWTSRMTASQVMMLLGIIAGTVVGIFLLVGWVNTVSYSRLYSDLDESEAGEVVAYLNDNKIPYELSDGGRTVLVPSGDVYKTRISLASQGLPRNGNIGYSIFDKNNLGMTDFLQNLNFRRALEGELVRTITQLSEVQAARVHIVMPRERLFKEDKKEATASVVLKLKSGGLTKQQINGITHLVASSVEGLKPANIAIIDYNGNLLSSGQEMEAVAGLTATQLDVRKQVEAYLEHKAQTMLNDVLGPGKSVIRVTADLNFQQQEKTSEMYDPNSPSVRSEERTKTSNSNSDKPSENSESQQDESSETTITNYELNKTVEHIIGSVGTINRLSVAVIVDGIYTSAEGDNGATETTYQPRPQEEIDRLSSIVKNAVGFDPQRNDQIEMVNLPFDRQNLENEQKALDSFYTRDFYMEIARKVGYFLLVAFLFLYFKKKAKKLFAAIGKLMPPPRTVEMKSMPIESNEEEEEPARRILPEKRKPRLVDEMQEAAKGQPEEIAKVIRTMMVD